MVYKAGKKKRPPSVDTDTDGTTEDEGEPSIRVMIIAMAAMLDTLTIRMEGLERKQITAPYPLTVEEPGGEGLSLATHLIVEDMEDDNVDMDSGHTNDHGLNSSCHPPMDFQQPHLAFQLPAPPLSTSRAALVALLTCAQAHAATSNFQTPEAPLGPTQVASAASLTSAQAHAATSNFQSPVPPLGTTEAASTAPITCAQVHASSSKQPFPILAIHDHSMSYFDMADGNVDIDSGYTDSCCHQPQRTALWPSP